MKLIIGLGNPDGEYRNNRHNVGHMFIDFVGELQNVVVKKTTLFMNSSGESVSSISKYYKAEVDDIYVVHDDLDIRLGEYKIQKGKGPKDHNGIISVNKALGDEGYWRIRIGVENRNDSFIIGGRDYVLDDFTEEEVEIIKQVFVKIKDELERIL